MLEDDDDEDDICISPNHTDSEAEMELVPEDDGLINNNNRDDIRIITGCDDVDQDEQIDDDAASASPEITR